MRKFTLTFMCMISISAFCVIRDDTANYWDYSRLTQAPAYREVEYAESQYPGLRAILFDGADYKGQPRKVFAYVGLPDTPAPDGGFPGMVILHGGGGTAYGWAVKLWNSYGYAVIAIDWYNRRPADMNGEKRIPLEGGARETYEHDDHLCAVADTVLAHSLLRSLPKVNPDKIGFMGLSWGSWYGSTIAALDPRFRCFINIFCGNLWPNQKNNSSFSLVDGRFLHAAKSPMYWVAGTNDSNASLTSLQAGFDECANLWNKSLIVELPHSHDGFRLQVCRRVADHFLKGDSGLPKLGKNEFNDGVLSAPVLSQGKGIRKAILCYTCTRHYRLNPHRRKWMSVPAAIEDGRVWAKLPDKMVQCFFSVYDELPEEQHCCASGDLFECTAVPSMDAAQQVTESQEPILAEEFEGNTGCGVLQGNAEYVEGVSGKAIRLSNATVTYPLLEQATPEEGTLMLWIRPVNWEWNKEQFIFFLSTPGLILYKYHIPLGLLINYGQSGKEDTYASVKWDGFPSRRWMCLAATWSRKNSRVELYVNGSKVGSAPLRDSMILPELEDWVLNPPPFSPNDRNNATEYDMLRIYNRALSETEIQGAYQKESRSGKK